MTEKRASSRGRFHGRSRSRSTQNKVEGTSPEGKGLVAIPVILRAQPDRGASPEGKNLAFGEVQIQKRDPPPPGKRSGKSPASLRFIPADTVAFRPGANVAAIEKLTCLC